MGRDYYSQQATTAAVGLELVSRGWRLCGWSDDQSDMQTDYFHPASWDGVATHLERPGVVLCVNVSAYTAEHRSGGQRVTEYQPAEQCTRCKGAKADPDGWTLADARLAPREYHASRNAGAGAIAIFPTVVSPIPFFDVLKEDEPRELVGRERCRKCSGRGHSLAPVERIIPWPCFGATPKGSSWHVERDGRIIARGSGVFSCDDSREKISALVDKLERAADSAEQPATPAGDRVSISAGKKPGYVEVRFTAKPDEQTRAELKAAGFRWAKFSGCWYGLGASLPERYGKRDQGHAPDLDVALGY
jgi:hypothetical protein